MEDHDGAYHVWRAAGIHGRTLVHVDAHHDLVASSTTVPLTIANYVLAALREEMIREIIWIVPDPTWQSPSRRRAVRDHLRAISGEQAADVQGPDGALREMWVRFSSGARLRTGSWDVLATVAEPVLLDIDVDYFLIPFISYRAPDQHAEFPWCWPEDLLTQLRLRSISTDMVTIAYSVNGGYTPLRWKYLGEELAMRLQSSEASSLPARWGNVMREAAEALRENRVDRAESLFRGAVELRKASPAPHYALAQVFVDQGRIADARAELARARELSPLYRTPYSNAGIHFGRQGLLSQAQAEFQRALVMDPDDASARAGLGWITALRGRWHEAERWLNEALALDPNQLDAWRLLGDIMVKQRRWREAALAFERSLKLALAGHRSLSACITSSPESSLADPDHAATFARSARVLERLGEHRTAIANHRIGMAAGIDGWIPHLRLARLYAKQGAWRSSLTEARAAVTRLPATVADIRRLVRGTMSGKRKVLQPFSLG